MPLKISHTGDAHLDYMNWYFRHLPRAAGVNPDGRQNNWWKYLLDFQNYAADGRPLPPRAWLVGQAVALREMSFRSFLIAPRRGRASVIVN